MPIQIAARFAFEVDHPTDALLQFEVAVLPDQAVEDVTRIMPEDQETSRTPALDGVGERIWIEADGRVEIDYSAKVIVARRAADIATLASPASSDLPGEAVQYLFDSRYCPADAFQHFVAEHFAGTHGGARVEAIRAWIAANFTYVPGVSDSSTDAAQSFVARQGICRDYAHVLIMLARASAIPARYVACYAPRVSPPDFHAVAQVYLADPEVPESGSWHLVDATGMAAPEEIAIIGIGRDAADVSFLTSFGPHQLMSYAVEVRED